MEGKDRVDLSRRLCRVGIKGRGKGGNMDIEKFADIILKGVKKAGMPDAEVERIKSGLFGIAVSDDSQFLIKVAKREPEQEEALLEMEGIEGRIHEIYKRFADSWEFDAILRHNDFEIDDLVGDMELGAYRKLENYILQYCSRNNELLFRMGFKYAWSLFMECAKKEGTVNLKDIKI